MPSFLDQKRLEIHKKVLSKISEFVAGITAFCLVFSILLTLSNWPAYSRIIQDIIDPEAMAEKYEISNVELENQKNYQELAKKIQEKIKPNFGLGETAEKKQEIFNLSELGQLYPQEMRLEVPKVFSGTIMVKEVPEQDFDFARFYESENKIQEALRDGVVHYPYTANPNQYGNVFITGHSSYYPWDKGKYKDIFALLYKLEEGDEYFIYFQGEKYSYRVTEKFEINPDDVSVLEQPVEQRISTLMTCTPVGTVLRRLVVRGELKEN